MATLLFFSTTIVVGAGIVLAAGTPATAAGPSAAAGTTPVAAPATFYAVLSAAAWPMGDVFQGPWARGADGAGRLAIHAATKQVYASIEGAYEILLDSPNDAAYVNWKSGPFKGCRKYPGATIKPTRGVGIANWMDYYMCQWVNPSPCSWASVETFYKNLRYTTTVPLGGGSSAVRWVDVFWTNFTVDMNHPDVYACAQGWCGTYPKTVELQYGAASAAGGGANAAPGGAANPYAGVIEHLSHWTANQDMPPFRDKDAINHSDDVAVNISLALPEGIFEPGADWNCTVVG